MRIILALLMMFFAGTAHASWWIINLDNEIVAKCDYEPDQKDLESRGEIAIYTEEAIPFEEAEYRGNKIVKHVKTSKELEKEAKLQKEAEEKMEEEQLIIDRMKKNAQEELEAEGHVFKYF